MDRCSWPALSEAIAALCRSAPSEVIQVEASLGIGERLSVLQTSGVTKQLRSADDVIAELLGNPVDAGQVPTVAPAAAGLYAWWASPEVLPALKGPAHPSTPNLRLLYIGIATKLRSRLANHLGRSGSSTLRRTLAGFLLDEERYRTRWTDRVVLVDDDERARVAVYPADTVPTTGEPLDPQ